MNKTRISNISSPPSKRRVGRIPRSKERKGDKVNFRMLLNSKKGKTNIEKILKQSSPSFKYSNKFRNKIQSLSGFNCKGIYVTKNDENGSENNIIKNRLQFNKERKVKKTMNRSMKGLRVKNIGNFQQKKISQQQARNSRHEQLMESKRRSETSQIYKIDSHSPMNSTNYSGKANKKGRQKMMILKNIFDVNQYSPTSSKASRQNRGEYSSNQYVPFNKNKFSIIEPNQTSNPKKLIHQRKISKNGIRFDKLNIFTEVSKDNHSILSAHSPEKEKSTMGHRRNKTDLVTLESFNSRKSSGKSTKNLNHLLNKKKYRRSIQAPKSQEIKSKYLNGKLKLIANKTRKNIQNSKNSKKSQENPLNKSHNLHGIDKQEIEGYLKLKIIPRSESQGQIKTMELKKAINKLNSNFIPAPYKDYKLEQNEFLFPKRIEARTLKGVNLKNPSKRNQDSYICINNFIGRKNLAILGVFDGHGFCINNEGFFGDRVSQFCREHFLTEFETEILKNEYTIDQKYGFEEIIYLTLQKVNKKLKNSHINIDMSGTTCNLCVINENILYVTNIGDSRSALGFLDKNGLTQTKVLSVDHTPEVKSEKDRIIRNGGRVRSALNQHGSSNGPLRVWLKTTNSPGLAMTRSIGDLVAERVGVTWKPEIAIYKLGPHDHSLIVASDGVWDVFSNHEVINTLGIFHQQGKSIDECCNFIISATQKRWGKSGTRDDITFVVAFLNKRQQK